MFRLSWNSVLARKVRLVMSGLAIVLGVAFITGSLTFGDMISKVYNGLLKGTVADINVRALGQGENTSQVIYREITAAQVAKMREIAGVASVHGVILVTDAYPFSKTHKIIGGGGAPGSQPARVVAGSCVLARWLGGGGAQARAGFTICHSRS